MSDKRLINIFNKTVETLEPDNPIRPKGDIHSLEYNMALAWFMMGYSAGFETQEDKIEELKNQVAQYNGPKNV